MSRQRDESLLTAYALGEVDATERATVEAWLQESEEARAQLEEIRQSVAFLEDEFAAEPAAGLTPEQRAAIAGAAGAERSRWSRWMYPAVGLAAAACLTVVVGIQLMPELGQVSRPTIEVTPADAVVNRQMAGADPANTEQLEGNRDNAGDRVASAVLDKVASRDSDREGQPSPGTPRPEQAQSPGARQEFDDTASGRKKDQVAAVAGNERALGDLKEEFRVLTGETAPSPPPAATPEEAAAMGKSVVQLDGVQVREPLAQAKISAGLAVTGSGAYTATEYERPSVTLPTSLRDDENRDVRRRPDFNTENYNVIEDNPFVRVADDPRSTFSIDVDTASYANVRRFLSNKQLPPPDAVRIEELINYFNYSYAAPTGKQPFSTHIEVTQAPWKPTHRLLRVGLKGREIDMSHRPAGNFVFLLDVSGSMNRPDKLPLVKKAMAMLTNELGPQDRIAMVVYAGASGLVLPSTRCDEKSDIIAALERLRAGGSTNGGQGIQLAYKVAQENFIKDGINRVILATDGDFNVGITNEGDLVRLIEEKAKSGVFLSVLGFGTGNIKDSTMELLSNKGNGNYAYIDSVKEAKKVLVEEAGGTLVTIAKDVKIQLEFNPATVNAFRLIGYENRMLEHQDFNDDTKDAGEIGAGHTVTALYEIVPAGVEIDLPTVDPLKYQSETKPAANPSGELLTVKLRYKQPDGDTSELIEVPVTDPGGSFADASTEVRFAASVAGFGMLLRDSPYRGSVTFEDVAGWAEAAKGGDPNGYRTEFVKLVRAARALKDLEGLN